MPGKFEGEPEFVEHFWNHMDEADENDGKYIIFRINKEDCKKFPGSFDQGDRLYLWEDDNGFVYHAINPKESQNG